MSSSESETSGYGSAGSRSFKFKKEKKHKDKKEKKEKKDKDKGKKDKEKKEKKEKDKKEKDKKNEHYDGYSYQSQQQHYAGSSGYGFDGASNFGMGEAAAYFTGSSASKQTSFEPTHNTVTSPPPYMPSPAFSQPSIDTKVPTPSMTSQYSSHLQAPPPSGYRIPLSTATSTAPPTPFPPPNQAGVPVAADADGSPLFIGSALFTSSVQPCKIGPHLQPTPVSVAYGGVEHAHMGRYDLLPFLPDQMEWVWTRNGIIPPGRRPIEGGYEENGQKLYHAMAPVNGLRVPGKTGEHLGAANVSFGGQELAYMEYEILCWRN